MSALTPLEVAHRICVRLRSDLRRPMSKEERYPLWVKLRRAEEEELEIAWTAQMTEHHGLHRDGDGNLLRGPTSRLERTCTADASAHGYAFHERAIWVDGARGPIKATIGPDGLLKFMRGMDLRLHGPEEAMLMPRNYINANEFALLVELTPDDIRWLCKKGKIEHDRPMGEDGRIRISYAGARLYITTVIAASARPDMLDKLNRLTGHAPEAGAEIAS